MRRRQFLKGAVTALAVPTIITLKPTEARAYGSWSNREATEHTVSRGRDAAFPAQAGAQGDFAAPDYDSADTFTAAQGTPMPYTYAWHEQRRQKAQLALKERRRFRWLGRSD